jgi:hypothetical protein
MAKKNEVQVIEENDAEEGTSKKKNKRILTLFILLFPSLLLAGDYGFSFAANLILKGALVFYQFVICKNVLDDYYSYTE